MKLQLIIEAVSKTDAAFATLKKDLATLQGQTTGMAAGGNLAGQALQDAGEKGAAGMKQVHAGAQNSYSMLGQLVQMAVIFGSLSFAKKMAESGIDYNKTLETSKLGIAAIMTSMGVITNAQGEVLTGQDKWNASQSLAVDAQRELQKIAMTTPATFEELVAAYQGILAPALAAKMTFKETLEFTGLMTNAVKAIGLPMQQIVQESRDLAAGTIDQNSQLARSLQITNDDVKKWREKGIVLQEIKERLSGFVFAQRELDNTWEGTWSNFKDIAQHALGEGSVPIFNFLKQEITNLTKDMVNITKDADGNYIDVQVKPEVTARIRELAEDLKKVVGFLESLTKWGIKLSEPIMWAAIAGGIYKIVTALRAITLEITLSTGGINLLIAGLTALGMWSSKKMLDAKSLADEATFVRADAAKGADGKWRRSEEPPNLDEFGWKELQNVKTQLPTADNKQIARMFHDGIISLQKQTVPGFDKEWTLVVKIDDAKAKQFLEGGKAPFNLKGPNKKTEAEQKKENEAFLAAMEDRYAKSAGIFKVGEAKDSEAIKTGLKEKELAWKQGLITEEQYLKARTDLEEQAQTSRLNGIISQQGDLTQKYQEEAAKIKDPKEASEKHKAYVTAWYALEIDYVKTLGDKKRTAVEEQLKQTEELKKLEDAKREGALKLLQEQLNGEKQLTQLLLDRERITPRQAEDRNIGNEQSGLMADIFNTLGKKRAGGLTAAQISSMDAELAVLKQRMDNLNQATPERLYKADRATGALDAKREEARISHELSDLDEKEKLRQVSKNQALIERKSLTEDLLTSQLAVQAGIDPGDTTAWNSQQSAIDGTRQKLLDLKLALRDLSDDMAGGLSEGFQAYLDEVGGGFKQMENLAKETAQSMQSSFSDFFFDAMQGKMKSFGDYTRAFLASIERAIANVMAQKMATSIIGADYSSMFSFRAQGGPVASGQPYIVGEKGMELFIPQGSGTIIPNHALPKASPTGLGGAGGAISIDMPISVDNRGNSDSPGSMNSTQAAQLGSLVKASVLQTILNEKRPGGLLY